MRRGIYMHGTAAVALTIGVLSAGGASAQAAGQEPAGSAQSRPETAKPSEAASSSPVPAANPAQAPAAQPQAEGLADIVVTAQRKSENLQRAAIAVTAVDATTLARASVTDTSQLTKVAPALQIGTITGSANTFYLRGVGNFTTNSLSDAAISFNVDGVPIARSLAAQATFYDLERVEVLKGPQGTLYGRNSTGGAINVITAKPQPGVFSGYLNGEYGNFNAVRVTGAVNVPMGENGALRIAALFSDHDGYYSDGTGDDKTRAVRVQLASKLSEGLKITVGADFAFQGGNGSGGTINALNRNDYIGTTDPRVGNILSHTYVFLAGAFLQPLARDFFNHNKYWGMYAQIDAKTPLGTLTILPSYRRAEISQRSYSAVLSFNERLKDDQFSTEIRLANDVGPVSYILGGYYLYENGVERPSYNQQFFAAYGKFLSQTNSYAGFGRLTWRVTDRLRLVGGLRYTIDDKAAQLNSLNALVICPASFVGGNCIGTPPLPNTFDAPPLFFAPNGSVIPVQPYGSAGAIVQSPPLVSSPKQEFRKLTYRAGVEFDLADHSLLYATYETGFKSGGFYAALDSSVYRPETIDAVTVGSKNRFLDNRLQLNIEAFLWNYKNQQVTHFITNSAGGTDFVTENVGATRIYGAEIEARALVTRSTTINATAQYLHARYRNFVYSNPAAIGAPVTGCPYAPGSSGAVFVVNCSGLTPANSPEWTIAGGVEQIFDLHSAGRLILNLDARYQSSSYTGIELLPGQLQHGYGTVDAQLSYEAPGSHITVSAFVNNLTNKTAVGFTEPFPRAPTIISESLRPPRTFGVRAGYKF